MFGHPLKQSARHLHQPRFGGLGPLRGSTWSF
jgi:hypothetical protein